MKNFHVLYLRFVDESSHTVRRAVSKASDENNFSHSFDTQHCETIHQGKRRQYSQDNEPEPENTRKIFPIVRESVC